MNIGDKVTVTSQSIKNGYESDIEMVMKYLVIGQVYTVEKVKVNTWDTKVYLVEVPNKGFNYVMFKK